MKDLKEGTLYKTVTVFDRVFELRYGYYEEFERQSRFGDPVPIYPDFIKTPQYTNEGYPFVTKMQELCKYGSSQFEEGCCAECPHYCHGDEMIGICKCEENRRAQS